MGRAGGTGLWQPDSGGPAGVAVVSDGPGVEGIGEVGRDSLLFLTEWDVMRTIGSVKMLSV